MMVYAEQRATDGGTLLQRLDFEYDVFGNRIEKSVTTGSTTVQRFSWDGRDIWADLDGSSSLTTRRVFGDGVNEPLARITGSAEWYLQDRMGSVRDIVNSAGAVVADATYDAWGLVTGSSGTTDRYLAFGYQLDSESGLYYVMARYMDPVTHLFLQQDPIYVRVGDTNEYAYVRNNPTNATDPDGREIFFPDWNGKESPAANALYRSIEGTFRAMKINKPVQMQPRASKENYGVILFGKETLEGLAEVGRQLLPRVNELKDEDKALLSLYTRYAGSSEHHAKIQLGPNGELTVIGYRPSDPELESLNQIAKERQEQANYRNNLRGVSLDLMTGIVRAGTEGPLTVYDSFGRLTQKAGEGTGWYDYQHNHISQFFIARDQAAAQGELGTFFKEVGLTIASLGLRPIVQGYLHGRETGDYSGMWQGFGSLAVSAVPTTKVLISGRQWLGRVCGNPKYQVAASNNVGGQLGQGKKSGAAQQPGAKIDEKGPGGRIGQGGAVPGTVQAMVGSGVLSRVVAVVFNKAPFLVRQFVLGFMESGAPSSGVLNCGEGIPGLANRIWVGIRRAKAFAARSITATPQVEATFKHKGSAYYDVNPTARNPEFATGKPIPGLSGVNNSTSKMHAEIGAMYQSLEAGNKGGSAVLRISGLEKCPPCKGDIKAMARKLKLEKLTVYDADGKVYTFVGDELLPIEQGGKGWK